MKAKRAKPRRTQHPVQMARTIPDRLGHLTHIAHTIPPVPRRKKYSGTFVRAIRRLADGSAVTSEWHTEPVGQDLRQLAKGRECYARLPGCLHTTETVVLAHIRRGHVAGMGQKPPDICAMPMCLKCHDLADGRAPHYDLPLHWIDSEILRGLCQWLAYLWNQGIIKT